MQDLRKVLLLGTYLGIFHILAGAVLYVAGPQYMATWWIGLLLLAVFIAAHFVLMFNYRKHVGGFMNYWQAFRASWVLGICAGIFSTIFNLILVGMIDPGLPEKIHTATLINTEEMMTSFGVPQEEIDKQLEEMEAQDFGKQYSSQGQLTGFIWQILGSAIFAFIVAAILKKNRPVFEESSVTDPPKE